MKRIVLFLFLAALISTASAQKGDHYKRAESTNKRLTGYIHINHNWKTNTFWRTDSIGYYYNNDKLRVITFYKYYKSWDGYSPRKKIFYYYDAEGKVHSKANKEIDQGKWRVTDSMVYQYHQNTHLVSEIITYNPDQTIDKKVVHYRDHNDIDTATYTYYSSNGNFKASDKTLKTYTKPGQIDSIKSYYRYNNTWIPGEWVINTWHSEKSYTEKLTYYDSYDKMWRSQYLINYILDGFNRVILFEKYIPSYLGYGWEKLSKEITNYYPNNEKAVYNFFEYYNDWRLSDIDTFFTHNGKRFIYTYDTDKNGNYIQLGGKIVSDLNEHGDPVTKREEVRIPWNGDLKLLYIKKYDYNESKNAIGMQPISSHPSVAVYPNPSSGLVHFQLPGNSDYRLEIYNQNGAKVWQKNAHTSQVTWHPDVAPGVYIYKFIKDGKSYSGKVIVK